MEAAATSPEFSESFEAEEVHISFLSSLEVQNFIQTLLGVNIFISPVGSSTLLLTEFLV